MVTDVDFDVVIVGDETEGCLAAVAAAKAGARTALLAPPGVLLGGLLTEDGLAFVDRDSRHLLAPANSPHDGIFGQFLAKAGVPLVALPALAGDATLAAMLADAGVTVIREAWQGVTVAGDRLQEVRLATDSLTAGHFIDGTPDGDLAEAAGMRFTSGFSEYDIRRFLGLSPLPLVYGVTPAQIMATCEALARDPVLDRLRVATFGERKFWRLEAGEDYVLVGPPHLGLAYQRWRENQGLGFGPYTFEADGFNVAVLGPTTTSWNGLIYFSEDANTLLRLSRHGADAYFLAEVRHFERFLREGLGWPDARVTLPGGLYVRQTRHALDVQHRLRLAEIATGFAHGSVGTFCYYPDFRGFRAVPVPGPLTAHVLLGPGICSRLRNVGLASRAAGYTPFAHSLCRLVQYNVSLGAALGVAAAQAGPSGDLRLADPTPIRQELSRQDILADDPAGLEANAAVFTALQRDPLVAREWS